MGGSVKIGPWDYRLCPVHGRLFLNGDEQGAICHHDRRTVEYSDMLDRDDAALAVAQAVSLGWQDAAVNSMAVPRGKGKAIASDGHLNLQPKG